MSPQVFRVGALLVSLGQLLVLAGLLGGHLLQLAGHLRDVHLILKGLHVVEQGLYVGSQFFLSSRQRAHSLLFRSNDSLLSVKDHVCFLKLVLQQLEVLELVCELTGRGLKVQSILSKQHRPSIIVLQQVLSDGVVVAQFPGVAHALPSEVAVVQASEVFGGEGKALLADAIAEMNGQTKLGHVQPTQSALVCNSPNFV